MKTTRLLALATVLSGGLFAQNTERSDNEVTQGTAAYKAGQYAEAVAHFQRAMELDPHNLQAQLYLATAYYIQWVPGADHPENQQNHDLAAKQFQTVLDKDPNNLLALSMMASMAYNAAAAGTAEEKTAALDEAARWNQRRIAANPGDAEPYYYLGVIDWTRVFTPIQSARIAVKMNATESGPITDPTVRATLQSQYWKTIEDGIANLEKCLELDPKNEDAMSYVNLLLRKKADLEDSAEAARADVARAEEWFNKAIDTRKMKATESSSAPSVAYPPAVAIQAVPPSLSAAPAARELRIGGLVAEKNIIRKVQPVYPALAKSGRIQGSVGFTVVIGTDGNVESTKLVKGHPLLVEAAKEAVMQWKYRPVLLKGQAVKIMTDVVINFTLVNE